ncbi:N-acetylmuramoyl-L-alanine amidase [Pontibaca salina]|uniref:N-acetylmuramoyl-L-alanine amidase n=1 Tax=Pontibaca salina TaxID=2795731 RepID=A0A934M3L7_9RHOB|nr:N-acetylmuramoyl-L-alanine amidase [Pontibaca salina]MBI6629984.1 N-acetylmuramoyl-L-alanine amidase [Pontibaca salina]
MIRVWVALVVFALSCSDLSAHEFTALARIIPESSRISDQARGTVGINLALSQGVPYRLFTLNDPPRLVVDFKEVDWSGLDRETLLDSNRIAQVQFGGYLPGLSRLVAELVQPMAVRQAAMRIDDDSGAGHLVLTLAPVSADRFAAKAGAPTDPRWDLPAPTLTPLRPTRGENAPLVVVLDPGHGGIDPGAEAGDVAEKHLMLTFARELREVLLRSGGFQVMLTRESDHFVSLERRIALAHQARADVFISLHADALTEGLAHGATVHLLSAEASDKASAKLAERHDRGDLLSGIDLSAMDDRVTDILLDLARRETQPSTELLARAVVDGISQTGSPINRRPLRRAAFSVLKAADIPSILIEVGFMSSPRDLRNLQDAAWRENMALGIRNGLVNWRKADAVQRALRRK